MSPSKLEVCISLLDFIPVDYAAMDISLGKKTTGYSKVVITDGDGKEYTSGADGGMTLTVDCPWASQAMADSLLTKFQGRRYQSYTAQDSFISPDADLGDKVRIGGSRSSILSKRTEYGRQISSTISAPGDEELDHEYEYVTKVDREAQRQRSILGGAIEQAKKDANDKILENYNDLIAALNGDDGAPEDLKAGIANYVRYDLKNNEAFAGTTLFAQIGEKARAEINLYTVKSGDKAKTFAEILADVIKLDGRVDVTGRLSLRDGGGLTSSGPIYAPNQMISCGTMKSQDGYISRDFHYRDVLYEPKIITSTTGTVTALGYT